MRSETWALEPDALPEFAHCHRLLVEQCPLGIFVVEHGVISFVNTSACRLLGASHPGQLLSRSVLDFLHPEGHVGAEVRMRRLLCGEVVQHDKHRERLVRLDGCAFEADIRCGRLPLEGRQAIQIMFEDVTQRAHDEEALQRSEALLRLSQAVAHVGSWEWDFATQQVQWSEEMYRIFEQDAATFDPTPDNVNALFHPEDRTEVPAAIRHAMETGMTTDRDYRLLMPDGRVKLIWFMGHAIRDELGRPFRMYGITLDVTERRALERRLLDAQKLESVGSLAGGVAHDFNNMLTAVLGHVEQLENDSNLSVRSLQHLGSIRLAAERSADLTRQLLAFARRQIIEPRRVDLNAVVQETCKLLDRSLGERMRIELDLAGEPLVIEVDPGQITRVIINLAVNGRDAMDGCGVLTIRTRRLSRPAGQDHAELAVEDTGIGLSHEQRAHLFEPYFTTKEVGRGTGLGLATCYGVVKQNRGEIDVTSAPGQGTTFFVRLPLVLGAPDSRPPAPPAGNLGGDERILVVEDESSLRAIARDILGTAGYRVTVVEDGLAALALLGDEAGTTIPFDLLVTDVVMPRLGGPELVQRLRARGVQTPVLFLSGYPLRESLPAGMRPLAKPFAPRQLLQEVRRTLDEESVHGAAS